MMIDVFLGTGVCVEVPDDTDIESDAGYLVAKEAARIKFQDMLNGNGFDVDIEPVPEFDPPNDCKADDITFE